MSVENSLEILNEHSKTRISFSNNAGRPKKINEIKFSTPPKSLISVLLSNEKCKQDVADTNNQSVTNLSHESCEEKSNNRIEHKQNVQLQKKQIHYCNYTNCSYATNSSSNLIKHKRIHTSEKPYVCDKCTFRTNFQNSLTVHQRIHTFERPYTCQHCDYRCNSSSNLKKHCHHRHFQFKNTT